MKCNRLFLPLAICLLAGDVSASTFGVYNSGSTNTILGKLLNDTTNSVASMSAVPGQSIYSAYTPSLQYTWVVYCDINQFNAHRYDGTYTGASAVFVHNAGGSGDDWRSFSCDVPPTTYTNHVGCLTFSNTNYVSGQQWHVTITYAHGTNQSYNVMLPYMSPHTVCVTNRADAFVITAVGERPDYDTPDIRTLNSQQEIGQNPYTSQVAGGSGTGSSPGGSQPPVAPPSLSTNNGVADRQNTDAIIKAISESK